MAKILILDPLSKICQQLLEKEGFDVVVNYLRGADLWKEIGNFDALVVRSGCCLTLDEFSRAKNLKAVVRAGVGVDNIDLEAARQHEVVVMNTPEGNSNAAAEHTIALMFALSRKIKLASERLNNGQWRSKDLMGVELFDKTLGIIGLGRIGKKVQAKAKALGMSTLVYDPLYKESDSLDAIYENSDYITLHVPLLDSTRNLINKSSLYKMKKTAIVINCSRGGVINEEDLVEALNKGEIGGAALDVFAKEPLDDHPLISCENVLLTPHIGALTQEAQENVARMAAEQLIELFKNNVASHVCN